MINVRCEVSILAFNGEPRSSRGPEGDLVVKSDPDCEGNEGENIILEIGSNLYTVNGEDLIAAAERCSIIGPRG